MLLCAVATAWEGAAAGAVAWSVAGAVAGAIAVAGTAVDCGQPHLRGMLLICAPVPYI